MDQECDVAILSSGDADIKRNIFIPQRNYCDVREIYSLTLATSYHVLATPLFL